jgi:hypothetical protein
MAFKDKDVCMSQPYLPYAWRERDIVTAPDPVMGLLAADTGVYVTTKGTPQFISGADPDSALIQPLPFQHAGLGPRSITMVGGAVVYASHDGLVSVRGNTADVSLAASFYTKQQWQSLFGPHFSRLWLTEHDGDILISSPTMLTSYVMRIENGALTLTSRPKTYRAVARNSVTDQLYVTGARNIDTFKGRTPAVSKTLDWRSKWFVLPKPVSFGALQYEGTGNANVIVAWDTGSAAFSNVPPDKIIRLPSGFKSKRWQVSVSIGTGTDLVVRKIHLATTPGALANV